MKYNKFAILFCIFLFLSMTPASASLQSDLNTTNTQTKSKDTNSLIDTLKNNNTIRHNNTSTMNGNNINNSVELLKTPTISNISQILEDMAQIVEYSKNHNITITDENKILLGTMIHINSIDDLKPGDIIPYHKTVDGIVNALQFYLLIISITDTVNGKNYGFYTLDLDDKTIKQFTCYSQTDFKNFLGYNITEQTLVFRADPSLYTLQDTRILPKEKLEDLLRSFNNESIEIEDGQIIPSTVKDLWWLWGLIPGVTTAIQLPFTWKLIVQKYRKCCCSIQSEEEIILTRQSKQLAKLLDNTEDLRATNERLISEIRDLTRLERIEKPMFDTAVHDEIIRIQTELRLISDDIRRMDLNRLGEQMRACTNPEELISLQGRYEFYSEDIVLKKERMVQLERSLDDLKLRSEIL